VREGIGVGVIAPMALQKEDLDDLHAICGQGLFPRVTTWIGLPRERVPRRYMLDFISLFAPHWPVEDIAAAATADAQQSIDKIASTLDLPLLTGICPA
jgi:LysR family cys regulon transcriptional activator